MPRRACPWKGRGPAGHKLLAELPRGEIVVMGDRRRPEGPEAAREIRADPIRFPMLGGGGNVQRHEKGPRVSGAWSPGVPDPEGCDCHRDRSLVQGRFERAPVPMGAGLRGLHPDGSACPGIPADQLAPAGDARLGEGFEAGGGPPHPGPGPAGPPTVPATASGVPPVEPFAALLSALGMVVPFIDVGQGSGCAPHQAGASRGPAGWYLPMCRRSPAGSSPPSSPRRSPASSAATELADTLRRATARAEDRAPSAPETASTRGRPAGSAP